jgi:hypothetical protein
MSVAMKYVIILRVCAACIVPTLHVFCVALIAIITKSSLFFLCHIFATMLTILATLFLLGGDK